MQFLGWLHYTSVELDSRAVGHWQGLVVGDMFGDVEAFLGSWEGDGLTFDASFIHASFEFVVYRSVSGYAFLV